MNEQHFMKPSNNESVFKFILPVLFMVGVQVLVQIFAGQLMFFYKGYKYTEGNFDDFTTGYQSALMSDKFTLAVTVFSAVILTIVFLMWYRREIVHAANMSLRKKCRIVGVLDWKIVPGVILIALGAGVFATFVIYLVTMLKPELVGTRNDVLAMINSDNSLMMNAICIIYFVVISPICQELVFRGLTLGFAERRMTFIAANIIQALLFGAVSMNVAQMIYYVLFGAVLGYIYYRTENILIPIICNMLFCVVRVLLNNVNLLDSSIVLLFIVLFLAMASVYVGVVLVKRSKLPRPKDSDADA